MNIEYERHTERCSNETTRVYYTVSAVHFCCEEFKNDIQYGGYYGLKSNSPYEDNGFKFGAIKPDPDSLTFQTNLVREVKFCPRCGKPVRTTRLNTCRGGAESLTSTGIRWIREGGNEVKDKTKSENSYITSNKVDMSIRVHNNFGYASNYMKLRDSYNESGKPVEFWNFNNEKFFRKLGFKIEDGEYDVTGKGTIVIKPNDYDINGYIDRLESGYYLNSDKLKDEDENCFIYCLLIRYIESNISKYKEDLSFRDRVPDISVALSSNLKSTRDLLVDTLIKQGDIVVRN